MLPQTIFVSVVNKGQSEAVLKQMQAFGLGGGVVFLGEGTVFNKWLEFFGLNESQKDLIFMPISSSFEDTLHELMRKHFKIDKKHRGISFSLPLTQFQSITYYEKGQRPDPASCDYQCIISILDKGQAKDCVLHAREAGAAGGTIIPGRGAGVPQDSFFDLLVEPQKDLVFFIVSSPIADRVQDQIIEKMQLNQEGKGVIFSLPVTRATGLFRNTKED